MAPSPPHPNPPLPPTSAAPRYKLPFGSLSEGVNQMEAVNTFSNCWCFAEYSETCFSKRIAFYTLYKQLESTTFSRILHTVHIHQAHHIQNPQTCWGAVMAHVVLAVLRTAPVVRVLPNGRATRMTGLFVLCSLSIVLLQVLFGSGVASENSLFTTAVTRLLALVWSKGCSQFTYIDQKFAWTQPNNKTTFQIILTVHAIEMIEHGHVMFCSNIYQNNKWYRNGTIYFNHFPYFWFVLKTLPPKFLQRNDTVNIIRW